MVRLAVSLLNQGIDSMDFTIAICTWNRADLLTRTLESFTSLDVPAGASWEVLVVNNRCTDNTDAVIASFEGRLPIRRLFEEKAGQSAARNCAIQAFRGAKLIFTDDDVEPRQDWIVRLLETFVLHGADVVYGRSVPIWLAGQPTWFGPAFTGQFALLDYGPKVFVATDPIHQFYGLNMAFTRAAVAAAGRYREELGYVGQGGGGGDDTDMFLRCLESQLKIVYQPEAVVGHMIPPDRSTKTRQRQLAWRGGRSNYRLAVERHGSTPRWLGVPRFMFRVALQDVRAWLVHLGRRERSEAFYREIRLVRFAALIREAWRHRRDKQAGPRTPPVASSVLRDSRMT